VEALVKDDRYREALDYLAARQPEDFAPSSVLPPRGYGFNSSVDLSELLAVVREADPAWVRRHLILRLDELVQASGGSATRLSAHMSHQTYERLTGALQGFSEGRAWALEHADFLAELAEAESKR